MKAVVLEKIGLIEDKPLKLVKVPDPVSERGKMRIKIHYCGVCRTDLHIVEGDIPAKKLPITPGHQIVGVVDQVGKMVKKFKCGDRVGITWLNKSCGVCKFCKKSFENLCENAEFTGYTVNGGYAEYITIDQYFAHLLPKQFKDEEIAPLLCAGVIGFRSFRMSRVQKGDNLGLVGFGSSAQLVIQVAKYFGCNVFIFTRGEEHQKKAKEFGAKWVGDIKNSPPQKLDSAIIFAPVGEFIPKTLKYLDKGGRLIINAIHMTPIPKIYYEDLWHEKMIQSVANGTREDAEEFLKLAAKIPIKSQTQIFPLERANEALLKLKMRQLKGSAVLRVSNAQI